MITYDPPDSRSDRDWDWICDTFEASYRPAAKTALEALLARGRPVPRNHDGLQMVVEEMAYIATALQVREKKERNRAPSPADYLDCPSVSCGECARCRRYKGER